MIRIGNNRSFIKGKRSMSNENWQGLICDGKTQPIFDYEDCIFEKVYVETDVDTDNDGKFDLVMVYIRRPKETLRGLKVPAIYVADPYMLSCNEDWYVPHNVDKNLAIYQEEKKSLDEVRFRPEGEKKDRRLQKRTPAGFAETAIAEEIPLECITDWYAYFNSRGYASVFCGGLGTKDSEGFVSCGSTEETSAFASVIDWLNGRCRAFTNREDNIEVRANWCTGNVAMSGKSYLGTMSIAVAMTGVEGLKTIIPEAAISNWYGYYRYNGLVLPPLGWQGDDLDLLAKYCYSRRLNGEKETTKAFEKHIEQLRLGEDRESGNYNSFWDERNYLNSVENLKASVFIVHGINDWNVKTNQCFELWKALDKTQIPKKMMLHQGEHIYIHDLNTGAFNEIMHLWLDYWLYGIENNVMETVPNVLMQSNLDQNIWYKSDTWPLSSCLNQKLKIVCATGMAEFVDDLALTPYDREKDNLKDWLDDLVLGKENEYCIRYLDDPYDEEQRLNGTVTVSFQAALDQPTAILSVMLVDYGFEKRLTTEQEIVQKDGITWGMNTPKTDIKKFMREERESEYRVISRGWLNAQNRTNIWNKEEIRENQFYEYKIEMIPTDYIIRKGHRLGLILYGTDAEATLRPFVKIRIKIKEATIDTQIPLAKFDSLCAI